MSILKELELPVERGIAPSQELFNLSDYADDLDGLEISDEQAQELLQTLWSIMSAMVDLGFSHDLCGQILEDGLCLSTAFRNGIDSASQEER